MIAAWKSIVFPIVGAVLGASAFAYRQRVDRGPDELAYSLVPIRSQALSIAPAGGLRGFVDKAELRKILRLAEPRWTVVKTNHLLHSLRLWGLDAAFKLEPFEDGVSVPSSKRMLAALTDSAIAEECGVIPYPFLFMTRFGPSAPVTKGGGVSHPDQYIQGLGEAGARSDMAIRLPDGALATLEGVIRESLANFNIEQEMEFTAVAYSRWLPPTRRWVDRHGYMHSFDEIADALMSRSLDGASCCGAHVPYALVNLLRANEQEAILDEATAERVESHLAQFSRRLEENQDPSGVWLGSWYKSSEPSPENSRGLQALTATGHNLEWIALAAPRLRPRPDCVERAARALARLLPAHPFSTAVNTYPTFSHACRALALMEEVQPAALLASESGD